MKAPVRIAVGSFHSGELRDVEFFVKRRAVSIIRVWIQVYLFREGRR